MRLQYKIKSSELPLLFQHTINSQTQLAVWKIEEPPDFFEKQVKLTAPTVHPLKQLQFLAGRYLLQSMQPGFPLDKIQLAAGEKPFIKDHSSAFSITHTGQFAAAIVSQNALVGIDMEMISEKALKVASRFLHTEEMGLLAALDPAALNTRATLLWTVKETVYKWKGEKGVDFREQILVTTIDNKEQMAEGEFVGSGRLSFRVHYREIEGAILSWLG